MNSPFDLTEDPQSTGECFFGGSSKWRQRTEHLPGKKLSTTRCSGYEKLVTPTLYPSRIILLSDSSENFAPFNIAGNRIKFFKKRDNENETIGVIKQLLQPALQEILTKNPPKAYQICKKETRKRDVEKLNEVFSGSLKIKAWDRFFDKFPNSFTNTEILELWEIFIDKFQSGFWHFYDEDLKQEFNSFAHNLQFVFENCGNLITPENEKLVYKAQLSADECEILNESIVLSKKAKLSYKAILEHVRNNYLEINIEELQ